MAKPRALVFLHKQPYPPSDSTKFRVYHSVIEQLAEYQRDVFIVTWEKANPAASAQLRTNGQYECYTLPLWRVFLNILKRAFSLRPWQVEMLYDPAIEQRFRALAEEADVIYVHTLRLGRYLEKLPLSLRRKVILDLNDSIARHYVRGWRSYPLALRLPVLLEGLKFRRYERAMVQRFEHVTIVGEDDRAYVAAVEEHQKWPVVIYTAVPSRQRYQALLDAEGELNLYFLGNYRYIPNREGIEWFLSKIWSRLKEQIPRLRFYLIGNAPASLRRRYRMLDGIEWMGFLSDEQLDAVLERMHIFISPVRIGAGIQGKIIEALFAGKPVIAAEAAMLWVRHFPALERFIFPANEVPSWKGAIEHVLAHYDELCVELCSAPVRSLLERSFSVQSVGAQYRRLADAIIGRKASAPQTTSTSAQ
jgi:glycosyltransferase involved in cell wall biosynthesis